VREAHFTPSGRALVNSTPNGRIDSGSPSASACAVVQAQVAPLPTEPNNLRLALDPGVYYRGLRIGGDSICGATLGRSSRAGPQFRHDWPNQREKSSVEERTMTSIKYSLLCCAVLSLAGVAQLRAQDRIGCKDSPLITRFPGSTIGNCKDAEFDQD